MNKRSNELEWLYLLFHINRNIVLGYEHWICKFGDGLLSYLIYYLINKEYCKNVKF